MCLGRSVTHAPRPVNVGTANMLHLRCCSRQHDYILFLETRFRATFPGPAYLDVADVNTLDIMGRRKMRRPKPYHHGNLREALLEAAIRLIAEVDRPPLRSAKWRAGQASPITRPIGISETETI